MIYIYLYKDIFCISFYNIELVLDLIYLKTVLKTEVTEEIEES